MSLLKKNNYVNIFNEIRNSLSKEIFIDYYLLTEFLWYKTE